MKNSQRGIVPLSAHRMLTKKPKNWREGQTIFNFLEFLKKEKNLPENQNGRMADPFYIEDGQLEEYYEEFLKKFNFG